jgi:hypothetical protein
MWNTEVLQAGAELNWNVTTPLKIPDLSHGITLVSINAAPANPIPAPNQQVSPPAAAQVVPKPDRAAVVSAPPEPNRELTNDGVMKLVKAGLGDEVVLNMIASQPGRYALDADSIVALKQGGVPDKILSAIISRGGSLNLVNSIPPPPAPLLVP